MLSGSNTPPVIGDAKEPVGSVSGNVITLMSSQSGFDYGGYIGVARSKLLNIFLR